MFPLGGIPGNGTQMAMMMAFSGTKTRGATPGSARPSTRLERVLQANGWNSEAVES